MSAWRHSRFSESAIVSMHAKVSVPLKGFNGSLFFCFILACIEGNYGNGMSSYGNGMALGCPFQCLLCPRISESFQLTAVLA